MPGVQIIRQFLERMSVVGFDSFKQANRFANIS